MSKPYIFRPVNGPWPTPPALLPRNRGEQRPQPGQQGDSSWWSVRNESSAEKTLYLYGVIGGSWFDEDPATADKVVREIKDFAGSVLNVRINSPGGMVFEGIAIANALRAHPARVNIFVDGLAASIASVIAVSGDRTVMMPSSQMMIHDASGGCWGPAADMRKTADMLDSISENIAGAYQLRAGGDVGSWRAKMHAETWYNAAEAVADGLADEVSTTAASDEPAPQAITHEQLAAFRFAGRDRAPAPLIERTRDARPVPEQATGNAPSGPGVDFAAILSVMREVQFT